MTYEPNPKEALFLWRLITSDNPDGRDFLLSEARPELKPPEREPLLRNGFVTLEKRHGRPGQYFALTERSWAWAAGARNLTLLKSNSRVGAEAMERLLRRLLPFLERHDLTLASLFPAPTRTARTEAHVGDALDRSDAEARALDEKIEAACLSLAGGARQKRVRLTALRTRLGSVPRDALDEALLQLQDERRLVLYRDDNTAALTDEDHRAALSVGGSPRHLVYLEV